MATPAGSARSSARRHRSAATAEGTDCYAGPGLWAARAGVAERAVFSRHLHPFLLLPGTSLGRAHWPTMLTDHLHLPFNYWWQAQLLDCLVDAQLRSPLARRRSAVVRVLHGIRLRNRGRWPNRYYDDMAWLALALQRIEVVFGVSRHAALDTLAGQLRSAWTDEAGGGIWWRKHDDFKNVPANGPTAIFFARQRDPASLARAESTVDWMVSYLVDPVTGLVADGLRVSPDGRVRTVERSIYSYCQGVLLGACVELAAATGDVRWLAQAERTIDAVAEHLTDRGVLRGHGGGDGGLFTGILLRYLADAVGRLPDAGQSGVRARAMAAQLVTTAAEAAWRNRAAVAAGPLFGPDWAVPASTSPADPARDLSVQLSGWMALEAAATLERTPALETRPIPEITPS